MSPKESLTEALFAIYATAGKEVEYTTEKGERRRYWANRFRQALQRATDEDDVVGFVERLVMQPKPSRGFGYLKDADRLDLSVEALVAQQFRDQFSKEVVRVAETRLRENGYDPELAAPEPGLQLTPGSTFVVQVEVGHAGALTLRLA
jgi:hypothetical protein